MATDTQIQIVREDPDIEAYRLGLIKAAKGLADTPITLPTQQVAGLTSMQQEALRRGQAQARSGIGAYAPYMTQASGALTAAQQALDPSSLSTYMNPYQQSVQNEIARSYQIQAQQAGLGAVGQPGGPSAYGGSRMAVQQGEIGRNMAQAMAQAQAAAFENAQRQQLAQGEALEELVYSKLLLAKWHKALARKRPLTCTIWASSSKRKTKPLWRRSVKAIWRSYTSRISGWAFCQTSTKVLRLRSKHLHPPHHLTYLRRNPFWVWALRAYQRMLEHRKQGYSNDE